MKERGCIIRQVEEFWVSG